MNVSSRFVTATPPTYHTHQRQFLNDGVKEEFYPLFCKTNDSLGIYITSADTTAPQLTLILVNQSNRDFWWTDQPYSSILTLYGPEKFEFKEVIIPEDGYYFFAGWYNGTQYDCNIYFEIIHVHASGESPTIIYNTTNYYNTTEYNTFNVYESEDPLNSEGDSIAFGWEFVIVAGVALSVVWFKVRKSGRMEKM